VFGGGDGEIGSGGRRKRLGVEASIVGVGGG